MDFCLIRLVYNHVFIFESLVRNIFKLTVQHDNLSKYYIGFLDANSIKMAGLSISSGDSGKDQMLERYLNLMAEQSVFLLSRSHNF